MAGNNKIEGIKYCYVASVTDNDFTDSIKVNLLPEDAGKTIDELPYAFPLLPKMFRVKPKVGEGVLIITTITNDNNSKRFYIGPVISQEHKLYKDSFRDGADSIFRGGKNYDKINKIEGVFPEPDDIIIRGRKNADMVVTNDDVRIRAGVKLCDETLPSKIQFNEENPAYIKVKYHEKPLKDKSTQSTTTIASDKICLLQHQKDGFNLTDKHDLISDEELNRVIESAYKLPYGEKLVEFLKLFVECFSKHSHPFPMMPPYDIYTNDLNSEKNRLLDNGEILSDTVRIN